MSKKGNEKVIGCVALTRIQNQKLTGSVLGRDTSSIQITWKSIWQFLCYPSDKPTNNTGKKIISLDAIMNNERPFSADIAEKINTDLLFFCIPCCTEKIPNHDPKTKIHTEH